MLRPLTALCILWLAASAGGANASAPEWFQTARVFLIDAYEPPFAPGLEYDAEALAATMARMNANTVRISTMGKYALIPGVRFTPHPQLGNRDVLAETIAAAKKRGIRVVPYISTGHKLAWTMVTQHHPEYAQRTRPGGGPARSHMFVGEDHGTVCWNTPYRQAYLDLVEKVVRDYDIDGIYFDTWRIAYFWPGRQVCYCDGCRNGFRQATGLELPWHENEAGYTAADLATIKRYHEWLQDNLVDTLRTVRQIVKSHKDIPLIYNINNPVKIASEDPRIVALADGFLYERGASILERAEGVSLAQAAGLGVWPYVGEYNNWPRAVFNGYDYQQQIFTTVMFGGAPILALPWGYVGHAANRRFAEYPFGVVKRNERFFTGFRNYPFAAVVYSAENPPGRAQRGWFWNIDGRLSSLGAFASCLYRHVQASSALDTLLDDPEKMSAYRVLYLADIPHLSQTRMENIRRFVREGGGLVATYGTSLFDAAGQRQERFGLEELLRAAPVQPAGALGELLADYRSMTGGPYDMYLAGRPSPSIDDTAPLWHFEPVRVLEGGEVWKDIVTGEGLRAILPGVIVSQFGKGRVVYCASGLESLFLQANHAAAGDLLASLVRRAAGEPPPYEIAAPEALIANLTVKGNTRVLHLTNWTGNKLERAGASEYYLAPVENVRIRFQLPPGRRARQVGLLVEAPYRKAQKGSILEVTLPRVEAYQGVWFEME
jgi:hypothetical protein